MKAIPMLGAQNLLVSGGSVRVAGCPSVTQAPLAGRYLSFAGVR
jgi:hypothetical protein